MLCHFVAVLRAVGVEPTLAFLVLVDTPDVDLACRAHRGGVAVARRDADKDNATDSLTVEDGWEVFVTKARSLWPGHAAEGKVVVAAPVDDAPVRRDARRVQSTAADARDADAP